MAQADLVIVNYNTRRFLEACLASIQAHTDYPYRVLVVDNGSTDGSQELLRDFWWVETIFNEENGGYARACNQGIKAGTGEYIVLLNSDLEVTPGWLSALVRCAEADPRIAVVGPKMVNAEGLIVGAGVTRLDSLCSPRGWHQPDGPEVFAEETDCVSVGGACYFLKRGLIPELGLFDENYFLYFEETDYSLNARAHGYRVVYCPHSRVIHHHEGTLAPGDEAGRALRNKYFAASQARFVAKWGHLWQRGGKNQKGVAPEPVRATQATTGSGVIVAFGITPWAFRFQRSQHLLTGLTRHGYRVLYVNNVCTGGEAALHQAAPGIWVLEPPGLGLVPDFLASVGAEQRLAHAVRLAMRELGFAYPILWFDAPYWEPLLKHLGRRLLIFNLMDEYSAFADLAAHRGRLMAQERILLNKAEIILASAQGLLAKAGGNPNAVWLPNAVDLAHFASVRRRELSCPPELREARRPLIGYYGAIAEWFDVELLTAVAGELKDFTFALIGHVSTDVEALAKLPNVVFLGERAYETLPAYLQEFAACIIPFRRNPLTAATDPVKLYEYLAAGKPVVSVDLPEVRRFREYITLAGTPTAFAAGLRQAVEGDTPEQAEARAAAVAGETWEARCRVVADLIRERDVARAGYREGRPTPGKTVLVAARSGEREFVFWG